jgi:hypothetical protein
MVIEVFISQVSVTSGGLDFEDAVVDDGEKGDVESFSSEIEEDVCLRRGTLVKTVGDSGGGRLVDDAENFEASNDTGILSRRGESLN